MTHPLGIMIIVAGLFGVLSPQGQSGEQTEFGLEDPVERPVPVPLSVALILKMDSGVTVCIQKTKEDRTDRIARWFEASEIRVNDDGYPDLVIKPKEPCLLGANVGPFWIFRGTEFGYQPLLKVSALSIEVLNSKTKKHRDVRASKATGTGVITAFLKFNGKMYQANKMEGTFAVPRGEF